MNTYRLLIIFIYCLLLSEPVAALELNGKLTLMEKNKAAAVKEYADAVVFFVPEGEDQEQGIREKTAEMRMENKAFLPRVLTIVKGDEVSFPNFDPILHNAFSTTSGNNFDLELYGGGESKTHVFDKAGLVRIYCNVHHDMIGYVLVLDTPHFITPDNDGSFALKDLPDTDGELFIWHPRAKVIKSAISLSEPQPAILEYDLKLTKRRVPKHLNKKGKSYSLRKKRSY